MTELKNLKLGVALCGSFCTFKKAMIMLQNLVDLGIDVYPIMSFNAYTISTRFGDASDFIDQVENITGKPIIHSIHDAEPLGPKNMIDALLIAPCTGNTLSKLTHAIVDTPVVLAAKSLLRNAKPIIIAISTND
ncbi:MAG: dipicolinate synthase subunit B, partial [Niameybacter sp.]